MVSTVCVSPGSKNTCEPPIDAACSLTVTVSFKVICFFDSASNISKRVMIFVTLAGGFSLSASFSYRMVPVEASIRIAFGAAD